MAAELISFTSGSCGNAAWIGLSGGGPGILLDAGVSVRRLRRELKERGVDPSRAAAVLLTHDHLDHIRHLGSWCKHLGLPVYASARLHEALAVHPFTRDQILPYQKVLEPSAWNELAPGISARFFPVPHDATDTVGYALRVGDHRIVWMTDLGEVTPEAMALAREADTVVIESNYDPGKLLSGTYTWQLKMRISAGGHGHLSNDACAEAIRAFWHPGLRNIFLCHLSGNNNTPSMAMACASAALALVDGASSTRLQFLPRQIPTGLITL